MNRGERTLGQNLRLVGIVAVIQAVLYFSLNHCPLFPSRALPLTAVDRAVPFWTWTVWPYLLLLSSDLLLPLLIRRHATVPRLLVAHATAMALALLTFLFLPTHYPRPAAPRGDDVSTTVYGVVAVVDSPECCCPSGHIIVPVLGCWALWRDGHPRRRGLAALLVVLAPTILTTKQHYLWDLLGAVAAAGIGVLASRAVLGPEAARTHPGALQRRRTEFIPFFAWCVGPPNGMNSVLRRGRRK
jgi:hypothetical protein